MVALKGKAIDGFLKTRDTTKAAMLVYGPDQGLVRERADQLARQVIQDFSDPFNYMELSDADLKADPSRLSDEITALSFMGGERVIRVRISSEATNSAISGFLESLDKGHLKPNGIVLLEGGDLGPRSSLRKSFEKAKSAVTVPCYNDGPAGVRSLALMLAQTYGVEFDKDALDLVSFMLGEDRGITRSELEKLFLYKGAKPSGEGGHVIGVADVKATLVESGGEAMDDVTAACADGDAKRLADALHQCALAGTNPISVLRSLQRAFGRHYDASAFMEGGENAVSAMKKLRPPVFFAEQDAFRRRLGRWSLPQLKAARRAIIEAELQSKMTGSPQREIVERCALRICRMVRR